MVWSSWVRRHLERVTDLSFAVVEIGEAQDSIRRTCMARLDLTIEFLLKRKRKILPNSREFVIALIPVT